MGHIKIKIKDESILIDIFDRGYELANLNSIKYIMCQTNAKESLYLLFHLIIKWSVLNPVICCIAGSVEILQLCCLYFDANGYMEAYPTVFNYLSIIIVCQSIGTSINYKYNYLLPHLTNYRALMHFNIHCTLYQNIQSKAIK